MSGSRLLLAERLELPRVARCRKNHRLKHNLMLEWALYTVRLSNLASSRSGPVPCANACVTLVF